MNEAYANYEKCLFSEVLVVEGLTGINYLNREENNAKTSQTSYTCLWINILKLWRCIKLSKREKWILRGNFRSLFPRMHLLKITYLAEPTFFDDIRRASGLNFTLVYFNFKWNWISNLYIITSIFSITLAFMLIYKYAWTNFLIKEH